MYLDLRTIACGVKQVPTIARGYGSTEGRAREAGPLARHILTTIAALLPIGLQTLFLATGASLDLVGELAPRVRHQPASIHPIPLVNADRGA